jgi:hypothetical protein
MKRGADDDNSFYEEGGARRIKKICCAEDLRRLTNANKPSRKRKTAAWNSFLKKFESALPAYVKGKENLRKVRLVICGVGEFYLACDGPFTTCRFQFDGYKVPVEIMQRIVSRKLPHHLGEGIVFVHRKPDNMFELRF